MFKRFFSESLLTLYEAAWFQTYNSSFNSMFKWQPLIGSNASFWDRMEKYFKMKLFQWELCKSISRYVSAGRIGDAQYILDLFLKKILILEI